MLAFRFDNTFEGLLSAVFDAYSLKRFPEAMLGKDDVPPLTVSSIHTVVTGKDKADRVFAGLDQRLTRVGKNTVLLAFLSEEKDVASLLFRYMRKIFDSSRKETKEADFSDRDILAVDQIARKVHCEQHLLHGFARFQKTSEGVYFAAVSPRYNVLALLLPHFRERLGPRAWIIYDARRGFGFFHENGTFHDIVLDGDILVDGALPARLLDKDEETFQVMWRQYFASATIRERLNPRLQARCLPRKFWPHMTEMRAGAAGGITG